MLADYQVPGKILVCRWLSSSCILTWYREKRPCSSLSSSFFLNISFIGFFIIIFGLVAQLVKNPPAMRETQVWNPGLGRSPGEGNSHPLQYSGLEDSMDKGDQQATVHGVAKSGTWHDWATFTFWQCWVVIAVWWLSSVAVSEGYSLLWCVGSHCCGFSCCRAWALGLRELQ